MRGDNSDAKEVEDRPVQSSTNDSHEYQQDNTDEGESSAEVSSLFLTFCMGWSSHESSQHPRLYTGIVSHSLMGFEIAAGVADR